MSKDNKKSNSILNLLNSEAKEYFLKNENYCNFDLPKYFNFEKLLSKVDKKFNEKKLSDFVKDKDFPKNYDDINYEILHNKDGKYAWRPLQLINPIIYVCLVHQITNESHWKLIQKRFKDFSKNKNIECHSIPRKSNTKDSNKAEKIKHWWEEVEQKSIEMALEYSYLTRTDITNCYPSIYTHSVAWAMHEKEEAKKNKADKNLIGNIIDSHLQNMSHGQTNGIPQGSTLMDFIAEMVLGYADLELDKLLKEKKEEITNYKILRYRDDYWIFSQSLNDNKKIIKCLSEVMIDLGMQLNAKKTITSSEIITNSIKEDKLYWMKQKQTNRHLQKYLLIIHSLAKQFPNSGSLVRALNDFYDFLESKKLYKKNVLPLISIIVDIAHKNPRTYKNASAIISLFLASTGFTEKDKIKYLKIIIKKFNDIPNVDHLEIWLQRIAFGIKINDDMESYFKNNLCKIASREKDIKIWNFSWLNNDKKLNDILETSIIDENIMKELSPVITKEEKDLFKSRY